MARSPRSQTRDLVLAEVPERVRLRELRSALETRRDEIGALDLEIETLREELVSFEQHYHARLAAEHHILSRIKGLTRHLERWADLLAHEPHETLGAQARRIDGRREKEVEAAAARRAERRQRDEQARHEEAEEAEEAEATLEATDTHQDETRDSLKDAYRSLARRYHPDLARTEEERLEFSDLMRRINDLYRVGDLDRLRAWAERAKGAEVDEPELTPEDEIALLADRLDWFEAVTENLRDERAALEASDTCQMMRNIQQAEAMGRDLIQEIKAELQGRVRTAYKDVREAVELVEKNVSDYNRKGASARALTSRGKRTSLERDFDPFANKEMVRLGLEHLAQANVSAAARDLADWIEQTAKERPPLARLLMLGYVSELSPFPLEGLESYDDVELRYGVLNRDEEDPPTLEEILVEGDDLVEFGVRRATEKVVHLGLRFRSDTLREAVPLALQRLPVRRILRDVLGVLGERTRCDGCHEQIFPVPLYRLRGLDNMRASACPRCGHLLSSYWMPKGTDVQAVLNEAFLDFELVSEWSFQLSRASVAIQLVPYQVDTLDVGALKKRFVDDIFTRYDIGVSRGMVRLVQEGERVTERTPLAALESRTFRVRFGPGAEISEADALELVRHRIRTRFS